jgi:hypothetical protein
VYESVLSQVHAEVLRDAASTNPKQEDGAGLEGVGGDLIERSPHGSVDASPVRVPPAVGKGSGDGQTTGVCDVPQEARTVEPYAFLLGAQVEGCSDA